MGSPDQEKVMLTYAVGRAIQAWVSVENGLCMIAEQCLLDADRVMSRAGFYSIENFRSKIAFVEAVYKRSKYSPENDKEMARLLASASSLSKVRNQIVHRELMDYAGSHIPKAPGRVALLEDAGPSLGTPESMGNGIGVRQVVQAELQFSHLFHALWDFRETLRGHTSRFAASFPLPESPPTIREIKARMLLELKSLLSPSELRQLLNDQNSK